ncbi:MAG TPA: pseudouridine synthase [Rhodopirellula baltica]|uniref:Pseudouridine synthase n=1 Tax=Rhodopirellula baltica (strain DSM 10527 / NCIMB 13988 / SH1) TaxID=243090 RepID=Q7UUP0_RHOBA|nr:pseudouridine synthase [Rhodopirellula baltica]CAD73039.1 ribosomal large subunit pseudouridine synthase B [Rhodopirellula baltica SH 1]HBE61711.1 pseudouridine synthase [Rhodopirellula baltica]
MPRQPSSSKPQRAKSSSKDKASSAKRINQLLASAGFGSRRQCEELIREGRVDVDGETITELGTTVDPDLQKVRVDGNYLRPQKLVYYVVNKPVGIVTTNRDPRGRPRVIDLVPPTERVFPVGRLDISSEGLILLTNDGDLAQKLAHPKFGIQKVYRVVVAGEVRGETMKKMREGIYIAEGLVQVDGAKIIKARTKATEMEIRLKEGKNREIRRILARFGHKVQQLRRVAIGPLKLGDVPRGAYRKLTRDEVDKLRRSIDAAEKAAKTAPPARPASKQSIKRRPGGASRNVAAKGTGGRPAFKGGRKAVKKSRTTETRSSATGPKTSKPVKKRTLSSGGSTGTVIGADAPKESRKKTERGTNPDIIRKRTAGKKPATKPGGVKKGRGKASRRGGRS